jgi:eukaryotic-like serine/threonine-protein kinase
MNDALPSNADLDARLVQVLDDYLAALQAGTAPDRDELLARHPELADDLNECLTSLAFIHRAAKPAPAGLVAETVRGPELEGEVLGDYRLVREVGRGGMGIVYEAEQLPRGRRVALKVLPFAAALDPRHLQRFKNEVRAAAGLRHANIVPVFAAGCERGVHFYVMELIEGQTLASVIADLRRENPKEARSEGRGMRRGTLRFPIRASITLARRVGAASRAAPEAPGTGYQRSAALWVRLGSPDLRSTFARSPVWGCRRRRRWNMLTRWGWSTATSSRRT